MTPQEQIYSTFAERFHKGENTALVSEVDIAVVEANTKVLLPKAYTSFLMQFGPVYTPNILDIVVLRKSPLVAVQEFLAPADVIETSASIGTKGCIAFASDCSGNLFCFKRLSNAEPRLDDAPIWLFDHETGKTSKVAPSFDTWLSNFAQLQPLLQERSPDARSPHHDYLYQVVIQFPATFFPDQLSLEAFGERIAESMPRTHEYDGYDDGAGVPSASSPKASLLRSNS